MTEVETFQCLHARKSLKRILRHIQRWFPDAHRFGVDCARYDSNGNFVDIMTPTECDDAKHFYALLEEEAKHHKIIVVSCAKSTA